MSVVAFRQVSKAYSIYDKPSHRLVELLTFNALKRHREHHALSDVSFEVERGEVFCLLGQNGSGKSTTLQLAAGIFPPTAGEVEVGGRVSALLELGAGFNPEFSGRDNVYLSGAVLGLSTAEIRRRLPEIETFAEIGDFIEQPVKTYSSGMLLRLAFATAINVDPDVLLVDEALAVGDYYFRQRCMRKVHELRKRQVTILFVSHAMADVKELGTTAAWLDQGRLVKLGRPDEVVREYLAQMSAKDAAYVAKDVEKSSSSNGVGPPEIADTIPNIDHRHGNEAAEIIGVATLNSAGRPIQTMEPNETIVFRVSLRAKRAIASPNVGFMLRNHLGIDFAGTNTSREGLTLESMQAGEVRTVDFHLDVPELYPGNFSFSPAVADGDHVSYEMCDWIENAVVLDMSHSGQPVYGYVHLPCSIKVNGRIGSTLEDK